MQNHWAQGALVSHSVLLIVGMGLGAVVSSDVAVSWLLGVVIAGGATSVQGRMLSLWGSEALWWSQVTKWGIWVAAVAGLLALWADLELLALGLAMVSSQVSWMVGALQRANRLRTRGND